MNVLAKFRERYNVDSICSELRGRVESRDHPKKGWHTIAKTFPLNASFLSNTQLSDIIDYLSTFNKI